MDEKTTILARVRCKNGGGKSYFCLTGDQEYKNGDICVFDSDKGRMIGTVEMISATTCCGHSHKSQNKIRRKATPKDLESLERNRQREKSAYQICLKKIEQHKLNMKLVNVETFLDASKATFYFTAEGRIDFRQLVKDLASELHTRIEMKQIGVRDEARMIGGFGCCGRELCCSTSLGNFEPVSIRMAKLQNLSLDPAKISGLCGRLMCCLEYEFPFYESRRKKLPRQGENVIVNGNKGKVLALDYIQDIIYVEFSDGKTEKVSANEVKRLKQSQGTKRQAPVKEKG